MTAVRALLIAAGVSFLLGISFCGTIAVVASGSSGYEWIAFGMAGLGLLLLAPVLLLAALVAYFVGRSRK